jgi:diguanylate cyclase (GGDEF)-like protein
VAVRLKRCVRSSDTVSRVGGDEFVVLLETVARPNEAALVARKIIDSLARPIDYKGNVCQVGASIGGAVYPDDGETMDEISKAADIAMYRVKHAGRNDFRFYSEIAESELD